MGGSQGALPTRVLDSLRRRFGVDTECFASPLNHYLPRYFSFFPDSDGYFGSRGEFYETNWSEGMHEVNPPFSIRIDFLMKKIVSSLNTAASTPLGFVLILPSEANHFVLDGLDQVNLASEPECQVKLSGHIKKVRARHLRATLTIPKNQHAYHKGNQEVASTGKEVWLSTVDTVCWWLQNDLADGLWPCSEEGKQEVEENWIVQRLMSPRAREKQKCGSAAQIKVSGATKGTTGAADSMKVAETDLAKGKPEDLNGATVQLKVVDERAPGSRTDMREASKEEHGVSEVIDAPREQSNPTQIDAESADAGHLSTAPASTTEKDCFSSNSKQLKNVATSVEENRTGLSCAGDDFKCHEPPPAKRARLEGAQDVQLVVHQEGVGNVAATTDVHTSLNSPIDVHMDIVVSSSTAGQTLETTVSNADVACGDEEAPIYID